MFDFLDGLNLTKYATLIDFVRGTMRLAVTISALIALVYLVWAGFQYIMSKGEGDKAEKAQKSIIYALIGLLLCFISPLIMEFVLSSIIGIS
ncbi:MAG: hypothetical protein Fur003_2680 [Candidatus Dojkabacteria bacterium]